MSIAVSMLCLSIMTASTPVANAVSLQRIPQSAHKADLALWARLWHGVTKPGKRHAVFARAQSSGAQQTLKSLGVHAPLNTWVLTQMDDNAVTAALTGSAELQLRSAPAHRPLSAYSLQAIDAGPVLAGQDGIHGPTTGTGVLVGFVDTGLDLTHPAFKNADGSSRVVAFWDQDATRGTPPAAFGYGAYCDDSTIEAGGCPLGDPVGHGTHVAGIAVGGGNIAGVASGADIAMVSSSDFTRLSDAVSFLMQLADARNQPLVVNISVGGQYGPHDGRTPLEDYLNSASRPGRILVAAAGNDGGDDIHMATTLSSTPQRVELDGLPLAVDVQSTVEMWTDASGVVDVALELWVGGTLQATLPLGANPTDVVHGQFVYGGALLADVSYADSAPDDHGNVRHALMIDRSQAQYLPMGAVLALRLQGQGAMQAWMTQTDYSLGNSRFGTTPRAGWVTGDGSCSIAVPATARQVIAVASYTIQVSWQSQFDGMQELVDENVGDRSSFSSMGPTGGPQFTGFKPDLVAPGSVIVSARADSVPVSPDTINAQTMVMQGTSMAAPHVTGVVALMLEADPTLDTTHVRSLLRQSARADGFTGSVPNYAWGYGKVDALAAVQATQAQAGGCAQAHPTPWLVVLVLAMAVRRRASGRPLNGS